MQQYYNLSDTWTDHGGNSYDVTSHTWTIGGSKEVIAIPTAYAVTQGVATSFDYFETDYHDAEDKYSCRWWLRSPGDDCFSAAYVDRGGYVSAMGIHVCNDISSVSTAVRPALWVNLAS